jgi:uridine kinase
LIDPSQMDLELLKREYIREKGEKKKYRRVYNEVQERCYHYQKMMNEYEKLYCQYLERSIKAEKDKVEIEIKRKGVRRALNSNNFVISTNN